MSQEFSWLNSNKSIYDLLREYGFSPREIDKGTKTQYNFFISMDTLIKKIFRGLKTFLKKIHYSIPLPVRNIYWPLIERSLYFLEKQFNALFPRIYLFEGTDPHSQAPLSFIYAGDLYQMQNYWDHMLLADGFQKRPLGRRFFWQLLPGMKKKFPDVSVLLIEQTSLTSLFLDAKPGFPIPLWVRMEMDITPPIKGLLSRQRADIERLIRKNRLSFRMSQSRQDFDDFYHKMYIPYLRHRYTDTASITPYEDFIQTIPKGEIIFIQQDGQTIAGASLEFEHGNPMLRRIGIACANLEYVRMGAIGAIYYFLVQELKKRGHTRIDMGGTRALLSDGLTKYKLSLGLRLNKKNSQHSCVRLMLLRDTEAARTFLTNNPFLFKNKKAKLCRAVFVEDKGDLSTEELDDVLTASACEGIEQTRIYVLGNKNLTGNPAPTTREPVSIHSIEELMND